jgi:hypothetical protein
VDGFGVRRFAASPTRGGDREFATSSDVADGRSSLPQDGDPEVCAREVSTRVGQVSGLTVTNVDATSNSRPFERRSIVRKYI